MHRRLITGKRKKSPSLERWRQNKRTKRGIQIAFMAKSEGQKFNRFETKDISNIVMHPHDNVATSFRNRENYQNSKDTDVDMDNSAVNDHTSVSTLDRLLNTPMGCENENHTAQDFLESCTFICVKCNLHFHDECLKDSAQKLKMDSYQKSTGVCVICSKKLKHFAREHYCSWDQLAWDSFSNA